MTTPKQLYANNTSTLLAQSITSVASSFEVLDGSAFPLPGPNEYFKVTIDTGLSIEIVEVWARSENRLHGLVRGREGTQAQFFPAGSKVELRITAESLGKFDILKQQVEELQSSNFTDIGSILFSDTPDVLTERKLAWDTDEKTIALDTGVPGVVLHLSQKEVARVLNNGSSTIGIGQAVYISGSDTATGRVAVDLAIADGSVKINTYLGIAAEDILPGSTGFVQTSGTLGPIDATGSVQGESWTTGDILYLSGTISGKLTKSLSNDTQWAVAIVAKNTANGYLRLIRQAIVEKLVFSDQGSGSLPGSVFNGSIQKTISYNTIGAPSASGYGVIPGSNWDLNAATATALKYPRTINGKSFDGSTDITTNFWGPSRAISFAGEVTGLLSTNGSSDSSTNLYIAPGAVTPTKLAQPFTQGIVQNLSGATSVLFTGIPSWAKRVTVVIKSLLVNRSSPDYVLPFLRVGTSSGISTSGYSVAGFSFTQVSYVANSPLTDAVNLSRYTMRTQDQISGKVDLVKISSNQWIITLTTGGPGYATFASGSIDLTSDLERVQIHGNGGTLDYGSVNILYE